MASCKLIVVFVVVGLAAFCNAVPADKQADVEAVPLEGPEAVSGPTGAVASPKDLKASSSYGLGYAYPYGGYPYSYGYGYPYGYGGLGYGGVGYYGGYYPRYYYGAYHGYPYFG